MSDAGTILGLAPLSGAKVDGRENSARGVMTSPSNQPINIIKPRFARCKRYGTESPHSLIGSRAGAQPARTSDLIGRSRIAGLRRGGVVIGFGINDLIPNCGID